MDRIQKAFDEIKELNASLQAGNQVVAEFMEFMQQQEDAQCRLKDLIRSLENILPLPQQANGHREGADIVIKIFKLCADDDSYFSITNAEYTYDEEKILQMEKEYLHDKLQESCQERASEKKHKI